MMSRLRAFSLAPFLAAALPLCAQPRNDPLVAPPPAHGTAENRDAASPSPGGTARPQEPSRSGPGASNPSGIATDEVVERLSEYADRCTRAGAIDRARLAWIEVLVDWDPESQRARQFLIETRDPFARGGSGADGSLTASARARLDDAWRRTAEAIADEIRKAARDTQRRGDIVDAAKLWRRVLRFVPEDEEAGRALGRVEFEGAWLEPTQLAMVVRDRSRRQVVDILADLEWPVEQVDDGPVHELLATAPGFDVGRLRGFRGPRTEVWGSDTSQRLSAAVQTVERTALFARALLAEAREFGGVHGGSIPSFVCVSQRRDFQSLVDIADLRPDQKELARERLLGTTLRGGSNPICLAHVAYGQGDLLQDWVARVTFTKIVNPQPFALVEGAGHAVCFWLFGRSFNFFAGPPPVSGSGSGTSSVDPELETHALTRLPDQDIWRRFAIEQAWLGRSPGPVRLLAMGPANMSNAARIEAYAWTRYLLARDPSLWRHLGEAGEVAVAEGQPGRVRELFDPGLGLSLDWLRQQMNAHWRVDEIGLAAWRSPRQRDDTAHKRLRSALHDIAEARAVALRPPFGAVRGLPAEVAAARGSKPVSAALAGDLDARSLEGEDLDAFELVAPGLLVVDADVLNARKTVWTGSGRSPRGRQHDGPLAIPGLRDLLLAPDVGPVRFHAERRSALVWIPPLGADSQPPEPALHPADGAERIPTGVDLAFLGAAAADLLGLEPDAERIGYPLSLHLGSLCRDDDPDPRCEVTVDGTPIDGVLIGPADHLPIRLAPRQALVFYPREPLPAASRIEVSWHWTEAGWVDHSRSATFRTR